MDERQLVSAGIRSGLDQLQGHLSRIDDPTIRENCTVLIRQMFDLLQPERRENTSPISGREIAEIFDHAGLITVDENGKFQYQGSGKIGSHVQSILHVANGESKSETMEIVDDDGVCHSPEESTAEELIAAVIAEVSGTLKDRAIVLDRR